MNESLLNRILKDHKRRTRSLALILCLSMIVSLGTFAGFHQTAIAKVYTREILDCPYAREGAEPVAHVHNDDCYEGETLVCTLPERDAHTHDDTCYAESRMLICGLEENEGHQHTEACFDENGELICQIPEGEGAHAHTDDCYTIERVLICNQPELPIHVHDAGCFRTEEITVDEPEETAASEQAVSAVPEMPVSDPNADLETMDDWNREFENLELSGNWARDLILVAATQQGRGESLNNFEAVLNDAGDAWVRYGYTRYGAWYGYPYAAWDAMFVSFCLRYAGIPEENVPNNPTAAFMAESFSMGELFAGRDYVPAVGDLIFFDTVDDEVTTIDHMGIVYHVDAENGTINTVEGDRTDAVATFGYYLNDEQIVGYGILPQNPNYIPVEGENTDNTDEAFDGFIFMTTDEEEEKQEETTTAEEAPVAEVPMPAQSWERTAGGIKVTVEAPEGAFPENTQIAVTPVNGNSLKDTVSDAVDGAVLEVQAVDITFFDAEGHEIEPAVPIRVVMTPAATEHAEEKTSVVHVDIAQQTAELIEQAEGTETDNSEVVFDAEAFTIYAIVYTVDFEYEVNGKLFTSSMPGAEDMPLSEIVKGLGIVGEEELDTFLSKIVSVTSTDEAVTVVTEDRSVRVLKDGDAQIVITMQDGAAFSITVEAEGITEISDENEVATVSTVNDLYLPASSEVKAELLTEEKSENAIAAVQTAAESSSYQAFSIALENVDVTAYDGFNVAVTLPEDAVVGRDFQLYQIKEDGTATDLTESLTITGEPNEDGLQNVSGISFTTEDFADFVLSYSIETFYTTAGGDTYKITLNYGPKAGIPDGAVLKVSEILPEDESYTNYLNESAAKLGVNSGDVSFARFFDIEIRKDDMKIEPQTPVQVTIAFTENAEFSNDENINVVHFAETGTEIMDIVNHEAEDGSVQFSAESFSIYAVVAVPSEALTPNNLDGRSFKIKRGSQYVTSTVLDEETDKFWKSTNAENGAVWSFESTETAGVYHIYTEINGTKQYMHLTGWDQNRAHAGLGTEPQNLTVERNNNGWRIKASDSYGTYYLDEYGNSNGFAGWNANGSTNSYFTFELMQPVITEGQGQYALIVKYDNKYYAVLNDGSLEQVTDFDEISNTLVGAELDHSLLWTYGKKNNQTYLRHASDSWKYDWMQLATDDGIMYSYINPDNDDGISSDTGDKRVEYDVNNNPSYYIDNFASGESMCVYDQHRIKNTSGVKYIGVKETANGDLRLSGNNPATQSVEIYFAKIQNSILPPVSPQNHTVNHIDISVYGETEYKVPLAYGTYYYYDDDGTAHELIVSKTNNVTLTMTKTVDVEEDDIKKAEISTYKLVNGQQVYLDDTFYITGYTGNAKNDTSTSQVRIEGVFKVADLPAYSKHHNGDENACADPTTGTDEQKSQADIAEMNKLYPSLLQNRLNNRIYYQLNTLKNVHFDWFYNGKQLYDANGRALSSNVTLNLSTTFDYWDPENECPPVANFCVRNNLNWKAGMIVGNGGRDSSGMDFKLEAAVEGDTNTLAVEIEKKIIDKDGNIISPKDSVVNRFSIFQKPTSNPDEFKFNGEIGSYSQTIGYDGYSLIRTSELNVGHTGAGIIYDYDVPQGAVYIEEDKESIPAAITDVDNNLWLYDSSYIRTEYVWRNDGFTDALHTSESYTMADQGSFRSIPDVLGSYSVNGENEWQTEDQQGAYYNGFLTFYVYNIYDSVPTVDVPVEKTWDDFEAEGADWSATLRLQWAPIYEGETHASEDFSDVQPIQEITITKEMMARGSASLNQRTFEDLPKYGYDPVSKRSYRIQYSLEEMEYTATKDGITYTYVRSTTPGVPDTYTPASEENQFMAFYPHDAGELREDDEDYYIAVSNHKKAVKGEKYIDFNVTKTWSDGEILDDEDAYATFKVFYNKRMDYRDTSRMSPADREANPITVTLKDSNGKIYDTVEVQPHTGLRISTVLKGRTQQISISVAGGDYEGNTTIYAYYNLDEETKVFEGKAYPASSCDITLSGNIDYLDSASILDTSPGNIQESDIEVMEFSLNKGNHWTKNLELLHERLIAGGDQNNQNVEVYEYYLKEVASNPTGFAAKFFEEGTDIEEGDKYNPIFKGSNDIEARNEPQNDLVVEKVWRGIPDDTGYPTVYFTLYQCRPGCDNVGNAWVYEGEELPFEGAPSKRYEQIPLSSAPGTDNNFRWVCPETLPTRDQNGNRLAYFVVESPNQVTIDGVTWKCYGYSQALNPDTKKYDNGTFGDQNQPYRAQLTGNEGTLVIHNAVDSYMQMDLQKQFFMFGEAGSWGNVTGQMCHDAVLGIKVIRRIVYPDNTMSSWKDYGDEMLVGYGENQDDYILDNGTNGFFLENAGGDWHFRIRDQGGDLNNERIGLPKEGYALINNEIKKVYYQYSFRETGVYKDADRTPYPEWDWYSNMTPDNYYDMYGSHKFTREDTSDDPKRIMNYQASDLQIDKRWLGEPNADEVYVKIWRENEDGQKEDFTAIIAEDIAGESHPAEGSENWQGYVDAPSLIDTENDLLILKSNKNGNWTSTVKIHNVLIRRNASSGKTQLYTYYIEEVGYKDKNGMIHKKPESTLQELETHYTRWIKDGYWEVNPLINGKDKSITLGATGENKLQVMNAPEMDLTVKKVWLDSEGNAKEAWQDQISFQIQQVSTKFNVNGEPTGETKTALVKIDGSDTFTMYKEPQNAHWIIKVNQDQHDQYSIDRSDNSNTNDNGAPWTFYVDGLQEGYFDADNGEWHCEYNVIELPVPKSRVTIVGNGVSTNGETITISNTESNTSAVEISKIYSGIDSLPDDFKIKAEWTDEDGLHNIALTTSGTQPENVTLRGTGSASDPYIWTISELPILDPALKVKFTESGFESDELEVEVTSTTDDSVYNDHLETKVSVSADVINRGNFTNTYKQTDVDLRILKIDAEALPEKALVGAVFQIFKKNNQGEGHYVYYEVTDQGSDAAEKSKFTVPEEGKILTLPSGEYKIMEVIAPAGYVISADSTFFFNVANGTVIYTDVDGGMISGDSNLLVKYTPKSDNNPATFKVGNHPGTALPQTGGHGTALFTALGGLMTATAGAILAIRRKRKPAEG